MSHIVSIKTEVRDRAAIAAACRRCGLAEPKQGTARLFSGPVEGLLVQLPGWQYPIACDAASGQIAFDNFNGQWGRQQELDRFLQAYACEKARLECRRQGHTLTEQTLADGSIKLTIQVGSGGAP